MPPLSEKTEFVGAFGATLAARLDRPRTPPRGWALFAHCFSCSKDIFAASRIAQRLAQNGWGVLRFDFTGLGMSQGDFANTNFSSNVDDLVAAAEHLGRIAAPPSLLVGHSLGGAAVIVAAKRLDSVRAVVTVGAPADAEHVKANFARHVERIEKQGFAEVRLAGRPFTIKRQFLEDISRQNIEAAAADLKRAFLIAHAPLDQTVSIENATRLFMAAKHPKSFLSLDDADHLLSRREHAEHAADVIAAWAERYAPETARDRPEPGKGPNAVVVRETGAGGYLNDVVAGDHHLYADEPLSVGGLDAGPNPYELLNAALGACTSITLRMYAQRKGWPVRRITVSLTQQKTHAEDCATCDETQKAHVDVFERELVIEGDLDQAQREKLLEIADKCPVHRTLHAPVVVRTRLRRA